MSNGEAAPTGERVELIADLLMGAAYADGQLQGEEAAAVRRLLGVLLETAVLPGQLESRIRAFTPQVFSLEATAEPFRGDSTANKRRLLELVAAVHEADGELDLDEDEYLKRLASALGMADAELRDLALSVDVTELRDNLPVLSAPPWPPGERR